MITRQDIPEDRRHGRRLAITFQDIQKGCRRRRRLAIAREDIHEDRPLAGGPLGTS